MCSTLYRQRPAVTNEPEKTSFPTVFEMLFDSPVSIDSFNSTEPSRIVPSQTSWFPCLISIMSDKTTSLDFI